MRLLLFTSSLFIGLLVIAQEPDSLYADSVQVGLLAVSDTLSTDSLTTSQIASDTAETIPVPRKFLSVAPYFDLGKLLTLPTGFEQKNEGGVELRFYEHFSLYGELGISRLSPEDAYTNGSYESEGTYWRIGAGYIGPFDQEHNVGLSFRYAVANFEEQGSVFISSPSGVQGDFVARVERENLSASWAEIVFYSDQKLLENSDLFWFGVNIRLRILYRYDQQEPPDIYAIPGYGRSFDRTIPALNLFLKVKI
ncbi:MAG: DUF6048 family protein [Bacteroidota bacterium]